MTAPAMAGALTWSLLHALWQGLLAWSLREALDGVLPASALRARYNITIAFIVMLVLAWLGTFLVLSAAPGRPGASAEPWLTQRTMLALLMGWGAGVAVCSLRLGGGLWALHRLVRGATPASPAWTSRLEELADRIGVSQPVRLLVSGAVDVPMVVGWLRPVILVPAGMLLRLPRAQVEAILLHELAHVRRHDWLVGLGLAVAETLLFHVPFVRWLADRARSEREPCCDQLAADLLGDRVRYARALLALESTRPSAMSLSAHGGDLMSRVQLLVQPISDGPRPWAVALRAAMLALLFVGGWVWSAPEAVAVVPWMPEKVARWAPDVEKAAAAHGLDPDLLQIVVYMESRGNPEAVSTVGARGLVQVMPATARRIAEVRGLPVPSDEELLEPSLNLDFGAWYLAMVFDELGKDAAADVAVERALVAYNGGPSVARAWLASKSELSEETDRYRQLGAKLWRARHAEASPVE